MADKMKLQLSLLLSFYVFTNLSVVSATVPLLLWGDESVKKISSALGQTFSKDDLVPVLENLSEKNQDMLVFLQDQLSMNDITKNADVYNPNSNGAILHHLKSLMQAYPSSHLPRVSSPGDALARLQQRYAGRVHHVYSPYTLSDVPAEGRRLLVVHLPQTGGSQEANLAEADRIIGSVTSDMKNKGKPYTAIYTAKESSMPLHNSLYLGRHLLQTAPTENATHFYNVSDCVYFYADKMVLDVGGDQTTNKTFVLKEAETTGSECGNQTTTLKLTFSKNPELSNLEMTLIYNKTSGGYWQLMTWNASYGGATPNKLNFRLKGEVFAPIYYSYHCTDPPLKNGTSSLTVTNFQTQAFLIRNGQFGTANDCVGFFTIPIWMGIIASAVLITILSFGLMLLANINSLDRFDDPKGKTISVNVAD